MEIEVVNSYVIRSEVEEVEVKWREEWKSKTDSIAKRTIWKNDLRRKKACLITSIKIIKIK